MSKQKNLDPWGGVCQASANVDPPLTLLYSDQSKQPREIKWLDCSKVPTTEYDKTTHLQAESRLYGMIYMNQEDEEKHFGVMDTTIEAYDTITDKQWWKVEGILPGLPHKIVIQQLAVDGRGHLFATDVVN